jgi:probable rRNA maturation factor
VHVAFVPDPVMRGLNERFRGIDRTTDVLSFGEAIPADAAGEAAVPVIERRRRLNAGRFELGEIVISGEVAARQARRRRWPIASEVAFLAAHGALHLLGFEDETQAGYRRMLALGRAAVAQARRTARKRPVISR